MQKSWYLVYTKPKCEKKVASILTKRKIENFCPQNRKQVKQLRKSKMVYEPLFSSYVFVLENESNISSIAQTENVLSLVYWKGKPAIIKNDEIEIIRDFVSDHEDIKLEKTKVNLNEDARILNRPAYVIDGNILTLKNKSIKVNLPSLGFNLVAELEGEKVLGREISFGNKELLLQ
ncbi:MAG: transcription termination/antitermination NusG family protein [Ginsengibacter sp.]